MIELWPLQSYVIWKQQQQKKGMTFWKKRYTLLPLKLLGSVPHATQLTDGTGGNGDAAAAAAAGAAAGAG